MFHPVLKVVESFTLNVDMEIKDPCFGTTESYFNKALAVATPLYLFYDSLSKNSTVISAVNQYVDSEIGNMEDNRLYALFSADLIKCYKRLGHNPTNLLTAEGLPMFIVEGHSLTSLELTSHQALFLVGKCKTAAEGFNNLNASVDSLLNNKPDDYFYLNEVFKMCHLEDLGAQYFSLLYRFFSVIAKADGHITFEEEKWLSKLMTNSSIGRKKYDLGDFEKMANIAGPQAAAQPVEQEKAMSENPQKKLAELIGLAEVKGEVSALINFLNIQQMRKKNGMKTVGISYHCVFTGNPGTGKTTVARILAEIYKSLGILKSGHLVETDRSGLVAEYVGQTAVKTNKIIDSALDGILFIDEAYSLIQGGGSDYGHEAVSTLLKRMEDDRERLVVVLAGYSENMKSFIDSNPGLQSRFNHYIHFSDYTADELLQIFLLNAEKSQYVIDDECKSLLATILAYAVEHKDGNFGNGRYVRNLFEKTIQNQAIRLSSKPDITTEELSMLKVEDLPTI